ncbi:hypothetical protein CAXC1_110005 [Candidatus Xenohaliotis californiensis]|uniref:Uncharacterized protein n=1 Tax=Candidatus Xenohaliotis californiensis TaxID=84677 RepID=A0ABM9N6Y8_9RICK|nr:hypothetical protein CAXC1_110005 [Candidatus Xenohaliotis californiensis]
MDAISMSRLIRKLLRDKEMDIDMNFLNKRVAQYRSKLLDTSRKSNLISFKHNPQSLKHIRVIDELPDLFYDDFLDDKELTFLALPKEDEIPSDEETTEFKSLLEKVKSTDMDFIEANKFVNRNKEGASDKIKQIERELRNKIRKGLNLPAWEEQKSFSNIEIAEKHHLDPSYEMPNPISKDQENAKKHTDKFIQTLLKPEEMSRKLNGLYSHIQMDIEESSVNTLYAAFGFLEWHKPDNSTKCVLPLLLLQLEIKKKWSSGGCIYCIKATGERAEINQSLSECLRKDFGIEIPIFTKEDRPESYM